MKTFLVCNFVFFAGFAVTISQFVDRRQFWPQPPNPIWSGRFPKNNFLDNFNNPWENSFDDSSNIYFQNSGENLSENNGNNRKDNNQRTTTSIPSTTRTIHLTPEGCNCPSTPQFNPVCGSDGNTYKNAGLLKCYRQCGVDVFQRRMGSC